MMTQSRLLCTGLCGALVAAQLYAAGAVGWRGDGSGRFPDADPPAHWSAATNVAWKTTLPARSSASPILVRDRLYICAEPALLLCLSAEDGAVLWQRSLAYEEILPASELVRLKQFAPQGYALRARIADLRRELVPREERFEQTPQDDALRQQILALREQVERLQQELSACEPYLVPEADPATGSAAATPVSDGRNVYVLFGNGVAACFDAQGHRRWARIISHALHPRGQNASPVLDGDNLVLHLADVFALSKRTGEPVWQTGTAPKWGSPCIAPIGNLDFVLSAGGDILRAHDGAALAGRLANLSHAAPLVENGIAYFIEEGGGRAIRLPAQPDEPFATELLWTTPQTHLETYASPVLHEGLLYTCDVQGRLSVLKAADGSVAHTRQLEMEGGAVRDGLVMAGGLLFIGSDAGLTFVFTPGASPVLLARNRLEPGRGTPFFADTRIFIRTDAHLWCIRKPAVTP